MSRPCFSLCFLFFSFPFASLHHCLESCLRPPVPVFMGSSSVLPDKQGYDWWPTILLRTEVFAECMPHRHLEMWLGRKRPPHVHLTSTQKMRCISVYLFAPTLYVVPRSGCVFGCLILLHHHRRRRSELPCVYPHSLCTVALRQMSPSSCTVQRSASTVAWSVWAQSRFRRDSWPGGWARPVRRVRRVCKLKRATFRRSTCARVIGVDNDTPQRWVRVWHSALAPRTASWSYTFVLVPGPVALHPQGSPVGPTGVRGGKPSHDTTRRSWTASRVLGVLCRPRLNEEPPRADPMKPSITCITDNFFESNKHLREHTGCLFGDSSQGCRR